MAVTLEGELGMDVRCWISLFRGGGGGDETLTSPTLVFELGIFHIMAPDIT